MMDEHITVKELIKQLQEMPQDALVYSEGCDCVGPATGAAYDDSDNSVIIER
jgi:hypothetical protein